LKRSLDAVKTARIGIKPADLQRNVKINVLRARERDRAAVVRSRR
jgi:hypothetical protein